MAKGNILDRIPGILGKAMADRIFRPAVLTLPGAATGPAYDPTIGPPSSHPCQALEDEWSAYSQNGGLVAGSDRKIMILASSLKGVEPVEGALVTVHGRTFSIVSDGGSAPAVSTDPARAVWVCRGRA